MSLIANWIWPVLAAPFVGSFLGVVIRRMPKGHPVVLDRSACESCGARLAPWDMVPLVSFLVLRGRCRTCGAPIAPFHSVVEIAAILVALTAAWADAADPARLRAGCVLGWTLLALGWIDWERFRLPDALTLPLLAAGLVATWFLDRATVADHAAAAILGYAALRLLNAGYRWLRGRDGVGAGDAKLFAACGAWTGLALLTPVLLLGSLLGLLLALAMRAAGRTLSRTMRVPFGSCLAAAVWVVWLLSP
ncbi:MAG: A24 family peptidase [Acetobacteraceae bacterium]